MVGIGKDVPKRSGEITWRKDWKGMDREKQRQKIEEHGRREWNKFSVKENFSGAFPKEEDFLFS